ncbi:MAG: RluA family pseudouridine synthase [Bacteroidales bacterium]|jgi:23S rRNA pseudouridine1911/1915/1917 synthase|nr:RluA family pseudouridine synthase [Bacteroidales bacterium]MCI2122349.1 RluA family pseudouridine synthase [Bacteroidales bacterium]MCI2146087.1 RluA family pseudouridine synthase [Bacteroidales bacterium]
MIYNLLEQSRYEDIANRILYEDNHVLIINKKAGEIVQGDKTGDEPLSETLKAFIAQRDGKPGHVFIGVPHRLDRPVSGIAMFAKTSKGLERLNEAFRNGSIHKHYLALVCAKPDKPEGELTDYLQRNEKLNKSFVVKPPVNATGSGEVKKGVQKAVLRYKLVRSFDRYWMLDIELLTGRHHQIRCQLASRGWFIKGDLKYGARRSNPDGGISLHARSITFVHPTTKKEITVTAPVHWSPFIDG